MNNGKVNRKSADSLKRVLIVGSSKLPIPAVKGGAVPNLIENILLTNEKKHNVRLTCLSCYDKQAKVQSEEYKYTDFCWISMPKLIKAIDSFIYIFSKKILHISRLISLSYFFQIIWFTLVVSKHLKDNNYDYVVFENSIPVLHSLRLFGNKKRYRDKYFLHIHTVPRHYYFNKKIISKCKKIICISEYVKGEIIKNLKISEKKFEILYNSIDTDLFKPVTSSLILETKKKYNVPLNKKIVVFAGRLCKDKGIDQVIKAQAMVKDDKVLLIVGSNFYKSSIVSDFEKELINMAKHTKENIIFTGYVDYKDMPFIYNCADVVVLPSMWDEPAGMTIIESMACKKPVITTISGGIPEYTGQSNCVLLERSETISNDIARKIEKITSDSGYANKLSLRARNRAKKFNLNYYYDTFIDILGVEKYYE